MFFEFVEMMKVCVVSKLTVDKWRVVLKGENPDYIHATSVHVSENLGVYTSSECDSALCVVCVCVVCVCVCVCVCCVCVCVCARQPMVSRLTVLSMGRGSERKVNGSNLTLL